MENKSKSKNYSAANTLWFNSGLGDHLQSLCPGFESPSCHIHFFTGLPVRPSHKFGFWSSGQKNSLLGEGRHKGLVPRNDVLTNGFIGFSLARILFVPHLHPPRNPEGVANLKKAICVVRSNSIIGVTL